ncbi:MAG: VOC family protein [Candidatus Omnitrophica bacterium]|nr:VOC family protein [Candidatus Omnitrophota bacterium]MCM8791359.1 VOC family protein [Candidatus Omnitrophota bacterium]
MIKNLRHVCIVVGDLRKAVRFYKGILGLKVEKTRTIKGPYLEKVLGGQGRQLTYVKMYGPGQRNNEKPIFELHCWGKSRAASGITRGHIAFTVSDLDKEYARLRKSGVRFVSEPVMAPDGVTKLCFGLDPDGNLIEFMEDIQKNRGNKR